MSGFFGVASKENCVLDVFFGVDYHSHLGTRRGGMAIHGEKGFARAIHNIENSPFRTKFEKDIEEFDGNLGIGCISDNEAQPLLVKSHLGSFAITTVGRINNLEELQSLCFERGVTHFLEMSTGEVNPTELIASLINHKATIVEGLQYEHIADDTVWYLCGKGFTWKNTNRSWRKGDGLLRNLREQCIFESGLPSLP